MAVTQRRFAQERIAPIKSTTPFKLALFSAMLGLCAACVPAEEGKHSDESEFEDIEIIASELINATRTQDRPEIGILSFDGGLCTATLITPRVAITARHCVDFTTCDTPLCTNTYNAFLVLEDARKQRQFFDIVAFTSFDEFGRIAQGQANTGIDYLDTARSDYWTSDDVALVLLDVDVPASVASPTTLAGSRPSPGDPLSVWGYGCTQRGTQSDINKRYRDFTEAVGRSDNLCPGDSGGPVTLGRQGEVLYVNSGYTVPQFRGQVSRDIYGDAFALQGFLRDELARWGEATGGVPPTQAPPETTPDPGVEPPIVLESTAPIDIPDRSGVSRVANIAAMRTLANGVTIEMDLAHSSPLDLAFVLTSPEGTRVVLQQPGQDNSTSRQYTLPEFAGEQAQGQWVIEFYDVYARDVGSVQRIELTFD